MNKTTLTGIKTVITNKVTILVLLGVIGVSAAIGVNNMDKKDVKSQPSTISAQYTPPVQKILSAEEVSDVEIALKKSQDEEFRNAELEKEKKANEEKLALDIAKIKEENTVVVDTVIPATPDINKNFVADKPVASVAPVATAKPVATPAPTQKPVVVPTATPVPVATATPAPVRASGIDEGLTTSGNAGLITAITSDPNAVDLRLNLLIAASKSIAISGTVPDNIKTAWSPYSNRDATFKYIKHTINTVNNTKTVSYAGFTAINGMNLGFKYGIVYWDASLNNYKVIYVNIMLN